MILTKEEVKELALKAGFDEYDSCGLSGESEDDRLVAVGEYPVGEVVLKFAALIEKAVKKGS